MILLAAASLAAETLSIRSSGTASAIILTPQLVTEGDWQRAPFAHKREFIVQDPAGNWIRLLLVENE